MDVGLVRMLVDDLAVFVQVGVLTGRGERRVAGCVGVVVVKVVVAVPVLVDDRRVPVEVGMLLGDQQPCACGHDGQRGVERARREFCKEGEGEEDAEERGYGKERARPGGADAPEGEEEEDARQTPVAEEPDGHGGGCRGRVREVFSGGEGEDEREGAGNEPFYG